MTINLCVSVSVCLCFCVPVGLFTPCTGIVGQHFDSTVFFSFFFPLSLSSPPPSSSHPLSRSSSSLSTLPSRPFPPPLSRDGFFLFLFPTFSCYFFSKMSNKRGEEGNSCSLLLFPTKKKGQAHPSAARSHCFPPLFFAPAFPSCFLFSSQAKTVTNVVQRVPGRLMAYLLPSDSLIQSVVLSAVPALYSTRHSTALYSTGAPALRTRQREKGREEKGGEKERVRARASERERESAR
jgi:hypothetical protein